MSRNINAHSYCILLCLLLIVSACMDISPPDSIEVDGESLLHSIDLPFKRAVYSVGQTDSIVPVVRLVSGDSLYVSQSLLAYSLDAPAAAISIDSLGRLDIKALYNGANGQGARLVVTHKLGEITKADTARVFVTNELYSVDSLRLYSLDTARSGSIALSQLLLGGLLSRVPKFNIVVYDNNGDSIPGLSLSNHFVPFLREVKTGAKVPQLIELAIQQNQIWARANAPSGSYWLGLEGYFNGNKVRDSIKFTQLSHAEFYLQITNVNGRAQAVANSKVIQPCALLPIFNATADTIVLDFSEAPSATTCGEGITTSQVVIPPFYRAVVGALGYPGGTNTQWTAYKKALPSDLIGSGTIRFVSPLDIINN